MGKHRGSSDSKGFDKLTPTEKAAEFDKSVANPTQYAKDNFQGADGGGEYAYGDGSRHQEYRDENERNNRRQG